MIEMSKIQEHMEVVGSDGRHVGRVDHVQGSQIELAKFDYGAGLRHHLIPATWVEDVEGHRVMLNRTLDAAKAEWMRKH